VELLDPQQLWHQLVSQAFCHHPDAVGSFNRLHQMTMDTLMLISLVSPIKPRQWAKINCWTSSANLSSIPSSPRRRRHLQQLWHQVTMNSLIRISLVSLIKPRQWAKINCWTSSASQSSIQPSPRRRRHLQQ
uniref:Ovule protein n=1 Tax=Macrostomum lignano TaxID=282301 RepID=A0A1I8HVP0_9PLAT